MERLRFRGTWGVGDALLALNIAHHYSWQNNKKVHLEMHWEHGEDYLESPDDPETIIQRMEWLHDQYHCKDDVKLTHVYHSNLFVSGNKNSDKTKKRFYFDSGFSDDDGYPKNHWVFKKELFRGRRVKKKIVFWTPTYNTEPPRKWKRFLTNDDWWCIIKLLRREGWILKELTYRTPVKEAFEEIRDADYVICYDGMWHYIAKNFAKPIFIPSWESVTKYHLPHVIQEPSKERVMKFIESFTKKGRYEMEEEAKKYLGKLSHYLKHETLDEN